LIDFQGFDSVLKSAKVFSKTLLTSVNFSQRLAPRSPTGDDMPSLTGVYRFGEFEVRVRARALLRQGVGVPLSSKAFEVLLTW
jgi:hypothetical protein